MEIYLGTLGQRTPADLAIRAHAQMQHHRLCEATLSVDREGCAYIGTWSNPAAGSGRPLLVVTPSTGLDPITTALEGLRNNHRRAA